MSAEIEEIVRVRENKKSSEEEIFSIIKKIIDKVQGEYPNSALFSMVIDSIKSKKNIGKIKSNLTVGKCYMDFKVIKK